MYDSARTTAFDLLVLATTPSNQSRNYDPILRLPSRAARFIVTFTILLDRVLVK